MGLETGWKRGRGGWKRGKSGGEIRCQVAGNPVSGKSGVGSSFLPGEIRGEIRCRNPVSVHHSCPGGKSGVSSSFCRGGNPVSVHHSCPGGGNPVSVHHYCPGGVEGIRCQFIILARRGNPVSVHHSCPGRNPVSVQGKSGVVARGEIRCQFRGNPVSVQGKSGVSSSFLPEKMNRHRITQAIVEAPGSIRDSGGRTLTTSPHLPQGEMP